MAPEEPDTYGEGLGTPENPIPEDNVAYTVTSRIDFTGGGALPDQISAVTANLRAFSQNPAKALLAVADQAQVTALKSSLSSTLAGSLEGWINTEIDKTRIANKTARQYATDLATIAETTLTKFNLDSELSMTPSKSTHALLGLNFRPLSLDLVVLIGGSVADQLTQHPTLKVSEGGTLTLGDQKFGLAFGTHAWSGVNLASTTMYGVGVQTAVSTGINCSSLAHAVALKCSGGACVGHESELRAICDGGGAALVSQLQTKVSAFKLDLFRFVAGNARLVDDNGDGLADRILDGTWDHELNIGSGTKSMSAAFTAAK